MQVLIFEPKFVGHFLGFASVTAKAFAELGCDVTVLLPVKARGSEQARVKLERLPENVEVRFEIDVPELYQRWTNAKFESDALLRALERTPTDHLVLPSGDFILSGLLTNGKLRRRLKNLGGVDLVMHNCQQVYPDLGIKQRSLCIFDRLAVSFARGIRLYTVDPFATSDAAVSHMSLYGNPVHPLPHFREQFAGSIPKSEARALLGLPASGKLLGSVGDLGRRKGTELLIKSFAATQPKAGQHLVLFGLLSDSAKAELDKQHQLVETGHIIYRDQFVTDDEFLAFFDAMDAIWAGFPRQMGIASTILYAAQAGRPVIASSYGGLGWMTEEYGLGRAAPGKLQPMTSAISWFLETEDWRPDPDGVERLLSYHTTENFVEYITADLRQRLRAAPTAAGEPVREGAL